MAFEELISKAIETFTLTKMPATGNGCFSDIWSYQSSAHCTKSLKGYAIFDGVNLYDKIKHGINTGSRPLRLAKESVHLWMRPSEILFTQGLAMTEDLIQLDDSKLRWSCFIVSFLTWLYELEVDNWELTLILDLFEHSTLWDIVPWASAMLTKSNITFARNNGQSKTLKYQPGYRQSNKYLEEGFRHLAKLGKLVGHLPWNRPQDNHYLFPAWISICS